MSLIVEDGTGLSTAESLISVDYFLAHHLGRGNTNVSLLSTAESEEALRRASDYFIQKYRNRWQGYLVSSAQALDWPRQNVILSDGYNEYAIDSSVIPTPVKQAFADLAFKAVGGELLSDYAEQVTRKKVDTIEIEYNPHTKQTKTYPAIDAMLKPYLSCSSSGVTMGLVRA